MPMHTPVPEKLANEYSLYISVFNAGDDIYIISSNQIKNLRM